MSAQTFHCRPFLYISFLELTSPLNDVLKQRNFLIFSVKHVHTESVRGKKASKTKLKIYILISIFSRIIRKILFAL